MTKYEAPQIVSFNKKDGAEAKGCSNGNQIEGDCETGGNPGGSMADCRNGANADDNASCSKGSNPSIT